ncbi:hypothetical protein WUBG_16362, partial [Wuchereria bancrofti]
LSTVSAVHRRLPPLPINSLSTNIISTTITTITTTTSTTTTTASLPGHYFNSTTSSPMSANLFSPSTIVSSPVQP